MSVEYHDIEAGDFFVSKTEHAVAELVIEKSDDDMCTMLRKNYCWKQLEKTILFRADFWDRIR